MGYDKAPRPQLNPYGQMFAGVDAIPLSDFRKNDMAVLASAGTTSLGITAGTHGSASPMIVSSSTNGTSVTETARTLYRLPDYYRPGQPITVRISGRVATARTVAATVDVQAYKSNREGGVGSDLCTTAAASINSTSWADAEFVINSSGLQAGDVLDLELTVANNDTGGSSAGVAQIGAVEVVFSY